MLTHLLQSSCCGPVRSDSVLMKLDHPWINMNVEKSMVPTGESDNSDPDTSPKPGPSRTPTPSVKSTPRSSTRSCAPSTTSTGAISKEKTICTVCEIESDNHHVHYGALACFSCRAFFRRAHNKGVGTPSYICKKDGECNVTAKNRKKCQRCRYDKCVEMGMNSSLVLTDEQKKVRFRKMLEKKGSLGFPRKRANNEPSSTDDESGDEEERGREGTTTREKKVSKEEKDHLHPHQSNVFLAQHNSSSNESSNTIPPSVFPGYQFPHDMAGGLMSRGNFMCHSNREQPQAHLGGSNTRSDQFVVKSRFFFGHGSTGNAHTGSSSFGDHFIPGANIKQEIVPECRQSWIPPSHVDNPGYCAPAIQYQHTHHHQQLDQQGNNAHQTPLHNPTSFPQSTGANLLNNLSFDETMDSLRSLIQENDSIQHQPSLIHSITSFMDVCQQPHQNQHNPLSVEFQDQNLEKRQEELNPMQSWQVEHESIRTITQSFSSAMRAIQLDPDTHAQFITLHYGDKKAITMEDIQNVSICYRQRLRHFAQNVPFYRALPSEDQAQLLEHNSLFFVQYILARYFLATSGKEQLLWLLGDGLPDIMASVPLSRLPLSTINEAVGFFKRDFDRTTYENLAIELCQLDLTPAHNPIVAMAILFTQTEKIRLGWGNKIQEVTDSLNQLIQETTSEISGNPMASIKEDSLDKAVDILIVLSKFYDMGGVGAQTPSSGASSMANCHPELDNPTSTPIAVPQKETKCKILSPTELPMPYTIEEEAWLTKQLKLFQSAYAEISLGDELVNEFIMFTYDVPLSKRFIPLELATFFERTRRILKMHPEFNALANTEQAELLKANCNKVVALFSIKSESFPTGLEQLKFCFGESDERTWNQRISPIMQNQEIKNVRIKDWNRNTKAMDSGELFSYLNLTGNVSSKVVNCELFKIISLMSMFSNGRKSPPHRNEKIAQMGKKYSLLLQRRAQGSFSIINNSLDDIHELGGIFEKLRTF